MNSPALRPSSRARRQRRGAFVAAILLTASTLFGTAVAGSFALAADTSFRAPTTTGSPSNGWANPANAFASDNVYATASADNDDQSYGDFGFAIPPGSIIDGITVEADALRSTSGSGTWQLQVRLSWGSGTTWTARKSTSDLGTTEQTYTLGGSSDTWGHTWDPTELSNANFRVEIRAHRASGSGSRTISVDQLRVRVTYRTIDDHQVANPELTSEVCGSADFAFVIDMSGSIGPQGSRPSNLPDLKSGIAKFVNAFQSAGGDGRYAGTRFNGSSASPITSGFVADATFLTAVNALSSPSGLTPTKAGITTAMANTAGDRPGVPNIMFVLTDGSPNVPPGGDLGQPSVWLQAANAAIEAADNARRAGWIVKAVYLSAPGDPGDTNLPFSDAGDAQWAETVMTEIGAGSYFPADFSSFASDLFKAIKCPEPSPSPTPTPTPEVTPTPTPEPTPTPTPEPTPTPTPEPTPTPTPEPTPTPTPEPTPTPTPEPTPTPTPEPTPTPTPEPTPTPTPEPTPTPTPEPTPTPTPEVTPTPTPSPSPTPTPEVTPTPTPSPSPTPSPTPTPEPTPSPSPTPSPTPTPTPNPSPSPTGGVLPATGTPPVTPPQTDTATLARGGVPPTMFAGLLAGLAVLTLIFLVVPAEFRRRR